MLNVTAGANTNPSRTITRITHGKGNPLGGFTRSPSVIPKVYRAAHSRITPIRRYSRWQRRESARSLASCFTVDVLRLKRSFSGSLTLQLLFRSQPVLHFASAAAGDADLVGSLGDLLVTDLALATAALGLRGPR